MAGVEGEVKEERGEGEGARKGVWYCPLYSAAFGVLYPCIKERCMWWDPDEEECAVHALKHVIWRAAGEIAGP